MRNYDDSNVLTVFIAIMRVTSITSYIIIPILICKILHKFGIPEESYQLHVTKYNYIFSVG